jgi:hypothetical protein
VTPTQADLAKLPYVRPVLPLDDLPPTPDAPGDDFPGAAHRAQLVVVRELNRLVAPLITQVEG